MDLIQEEQRIQRFSRLFNLFVEKYREFFIIGPAETAKVKGEEIKLKKLHLNNGPDGDNGYIDGVHTMDWCIIAFLDAACTLVQRDESPSTQRRKFSPIKMLM